MKARHKHQQISRVHCRFLRVSIKHIPGMYIPPHTVEPNHSPPIQNAKEHTNVGSDLTTGRNYSEKGSCAIRRTSGTFGKRRLNDLRTLPKRMCTPHTQPSKLGGKSTWNLAGGTQSSPRSCSSFSLASRRAVSSASLWTRRRFSVRHTQGGKGGVVGVEGGGGRQNMYVRERQLVVKETRMGRVGGGEVV